MSDNRVVRLKERPKGAVKRDDFDIRDEPVPEPAEGQIRVRTEYISLDPAMRGWMNEARSYVEPVGLGEVMRGLAAGRVDASRHGDFKEGETVAVSAAAGGVDVYPDMVNLLLSGGNFGKLVLKV